VAPTARLHAVTDHSEYIGTLNQLDDPSSALARSDLGKLLREHPLEGFLKVFKLTASHEAELDAKTAMARAWRDQKLNLHRNVIF
jgi:hypothetical protein